MQSSPLVSVIIPTYNRAKFLPTAIQSILDQTYKHVEIIVIDDGSTDNTKDVLEPFRDTIVYLTSDHKGTAHARNMGMQAAKGEYLAFLDSDDSYLPHKLELQVNFMKDNPQVGMVCTEFSGSYTNGAVDEFHMRNYHNIWRRKRWKYEKVLGKKGEYYNKSIDKQITYYIGNIFDFVIQDSLIPSNTIFFPKKILEKTGLQNESYRFGQEYEFVVRICKHYLVAFLDIPTYVLQYHKGQATYSGEPDFKDRKKIILLAKSITPFLNAVLDWAYSDKEYYNRNRKMINLRISELYREEGILWLLYDDRTKARQSFQKCYQFDSNKIMYLFFRFLSFTSLGIRRVAIRIYYRIKKWISLINSRDLSYFLKSTLIPT